MSDQNIVSQRVYTLTAPLDRYRFAVRARDMAGNISQLSQEWGIVDSLLHDVSIIMGDDMLHLYWSGDYYDDHYEIWEFPLDFGGYFLIGTTSDTTFAFAPTGAFGPGPYTLQVKRIFTR